MSLVNQMLLDLDARAIHQTQGPHPVKLAFLPVVNAESTLKNGVLLGLGIVVIISMITFLFWGQISRLFKQPPQKTLATLQQDPGPMTVVRQNTPPAQTVLNETPQKNSIAANPMEITAPAEDRIQVFSNNTLATMPYPLPAAKVPLLKKIKPKNKAMLPFDPQQADYQAAAQLYRQGRISEAESKLQLVLQHSPQHQPSRDMLIDLSLSQNRISQAQQLLRLSVAEYPQQTRYALTLARLFLEQHQSKEALSLLQENYIHGKDQAEYLAFLGMVHFEQKQYTSAVTHYQAALNLKNTEGRWWLGLGLAQESLRNAQGAVSAFRRAMEDSRLNPRVIQFLEQRILQHRSSN